MMYSSKTQGFYPSDEEGQIPYVEAESLPDDLIKISDDNYAAWVNMPAGKCIAWVEGKPMLIDAPAVKYVLEAETRRQRFLSEDQAATYNINLKLAMGRTQTDKSKIRVMPGWIMWMRSTTSTFQQHPTSTGLNSPLFEEQFTRQNQMLFKCSFPSDLFRRLNHN